ncbi:MAG TPA: hypothetical protein VLJ68_03730 [Chitinophagaceae bacterium]|nr:hypothetical protein [Chitinophagaceae bacterium]
MANESRNSGNDTGGMNDRLWEYIDGNGNAPERSAIEELLQSNAEWKSRYHELLELNKLMQSGELEAPSLRFTKNVMEKIVMHHIAPATKSYINKKVIWGLGIFFITLFVGFLVYGLGQIDWNDTSGNNFGEKLTNINVNKFFSNTWVNVFMMINVMLGLFLLDNYFSNKRKAFRNEPF